jgi:DNA-binding helix-hairpin-helix protein with protein kinase domain
MHKFYSGLSSCPWCALEQKSGVLFFIGVLTTVAGQSTFRLAVVWQRIAVVAPPEDAPPPDPATFSAAPRPLPPEVRLARNTALARKAVAIVVAIGTIAYLPNLWFVGFIVAAVLFFSKADDSAERNVRRGALSAAQRKWDELEQRWRREVGDGLFREKLVQLQSLLKEYQGLDAQYARDKQHLQGTLRDQQLRRFLDGFFIDDHDIPRIGATRKATLASFGIETAADIEARRIRQIRGFGETLTGELMKWRKTLEHRFVFNPSKGIDPEDIALLNQKYRQKKATIEGTLLAGPEELNHIKARARHLRMVLFPEVEAAARSLAQARADLSLFG